MTRAPRLVAHWVRIRPTPPAPACTSTVSPSWTGNADLISRWAVMPLRIAAAATSGLTPSGNEAMTLAGATPYSSYAPTVSAVATRSPTRSAVTPSPTASTVPPTSAPSTNGSLCGYEPDRK